MNPQIPPDSPMFISHDGQIELLIWIAAIVAAVIILAAILDRRHRCRKAREEAERPQ